jgi:hypothetical protein
MHFMTDTTLTVTMQQQQLQWQQQLHPSAQQPLGVGSCTPSSSPVHTCEPAAAASWLWLSCRLGASIPCQVP